MAFPTIAEQDRIGTLFEEQAPAQIAIMGMTEMQVRAGAEARAHLACIEQEQMARRTQAYEHCCIEGLGQTEAIIPGTVFLAMQLLHGRDCWQDADFLRSYQMKNPGAKPKTVARKTTVRAPGLCFS